MAADTQQQDSELCSEAHRFIKLYYDAMDRKREKTPNMYVEDEPTILWNGNCIQGMDEITRFLTNLPTTQHEMVSLDAQKISSGSTGGSDMIVLLIAGSVTVQENVHAYTEVFSLIMEANVGLKVKSQRFRYVD